jgi:subtilisin family serine protease
LGFVASRIGIYEKIILSSCSNGGSLMNSLLTKLPVALAILSVLSTFSKAQDTLQSVTAPQIGALAADRAQQTPAQKKISSDLLDALRRQNNKTINQVPGLRSSAGNGQKVVAVDVKGKITPELKDTIAQSGGTVVHSSSDLVTAIVPWNSLEGIAERPEVDSLKAPATMHLNSIKTKASIAAVSAASAQRLPDNEGDVAHAAAKARLDFGVDGKGVKVCVISDSVRYLKNAKTAKWLGPVTIPDGEDGVLPANSPFGPDTGEGTAMLEIVHRIAPGAELFFATGNISPDHMAGNIDKLVKLDCKIIVDDVTYSDESPFHQDAPINKAVKSASDKGVLYFSSAANGGNLKHETSGTWEGDFTKGQELTVPTSYGIKKGFVHLFAPNNFQNQILTHGDGEIDLFWNDPLGAATNEYDLFLADKKGNIIYKANTAIDGHQDPHQRIIVPRGQSLADYFVIVFKAPDAADRHLFIDAHGSRLRFATNGATHGHNASGAVNAFSVAATSAKRASGPFKGGKVVEVEGFSSDGPRRVYFSADGVALTPADLTASGGSVLRKPDLTAADEVMTDVVGFAPFKGTSAAAPHAAAIAALILSYRPTMTPAQVRDILTATALGIESPGWNELAGAGIAMPILALESIRNAPSK